MLSCASRYVDWADIALLADARYMRLLYGMVAGPQAAPPTSSGDALALAAYTYLRCIIKKRMAPSAKLALIQQLQLTEMCISLPLSPQEGGSRGGGGGTAAPPAACAEARCAAQAGLLTALATELLDAAAKLDDEGGAAASGAAAVAESAAAALLPPVMARIERSPLEEDGEAAGDSSVVGATLPLLNAYVARLRVKTATAAAAAPELQAAGATAPPPQRALLTRMATSLLARCRYPPGAFFDAPPPRESREGEIEECVAATRREAFTFLRNCGRVDPLVPAGIATEFLHCAMAGASAPPPKPAANVTVSLDATDGGVSGGDWRDIELALVVAYEVGEGAADDAWRPTTGLLAPVAELALRPRSLPHAEHRLVSLAWLELAARYSRYIAMTPDLLPGVLVPFLDARGLRHPVDAVAGRAAYLLLRTLKPLRQQLRAVLGELLAALAPALKEMVARPRSTRGSLGSFVQPNPFTVVPPSGGRGRAAQAGGDDRLYAFEAVGVLIGADDLDAEQQRAWLAGLLQPLVEVIDNAILGGANDGGCVADAEVNAVQQAIFAMGSLSKGFSASVASRSNLAELWLASLSAVLRVPAGLPRCRFVSVSHCTLSPFHFRAELIRLHVVFSDAPFFVFGHRMRTLIPAGCCACACSPFATV